MNRIYNPDIRENDPIYLLHHIDKLLEIGNVNKNASSLIYACLDSRIALEILDLNHILHSVSDNERAQIIEDSKPKNGIERTGKKVGNLKEKYQTFFQVVCEVVGVPAKSFDFKRSKDLQYSLSRYIHSYPFTNEELKYDSSSMQDAIKIIREVKTFITSSLFIENNAYIVTGIEIETIPQEDKILLEEWKNSKTMKYEDLKVKLKENILNRK